MHVPCSHFLGGSMTATGVTPESVFVGLRVFIEGKGFYGLNVLRSYGTGKGLGCDCGEVG